VSSIEFVPSTRVVEVAPVMLVAKVHPVVESQLESNLWFPDGRVTVPAPAVMLTVDTLPVLAAIALMVSPGAVRAAVIPKVNPLTRLANVVASLALLPPPMSIYSVAIL
jgi:hypothetical protein